MTPAQLGPSPTWPGIPDTPTPCTRISCGAGSAGAKEMVSTRWSGSSEHTHRALRPALGTAWPHALLDQHVDARRYEGSSSSAQNITVHHGALAYLLVINALRVSEAAAVRVEDYGRPDRERRRYPAPHQPALAATRDQQRRGRRCSVARCPDLSRHADPRTTEHYGRARGNLDRPGVHFLTAYVAESDTLV